MLINRLINSPDLSEKNINHLIRIMPLYVGKNVLDFHSFMEFYLDIVIKKNYRPWPFIDKVCDDLIKETYSPKTEQQIEDIFNFIQTKPNTIKGFLITIILLNKSPFGDKIPKHYATDTLWDILAFVGYSKKGREPKFRAEVISEIMELN